MSEMRRARRAGLTKQPPKQPKPLTNGEVAALIDKRKRDWKAADEKHASGGGLRCADCTAPLGMPGFTARTVTGPDGKKITVCQSCKSKREAN